MKNTFDRRKYVILLIFIVIGVIYLVRLFQLQVMENEYKLSAENNVLRYVTQYPARGLVYDRNNTLLVFNEAAYDLLVIPRQVSEIDTTELCALLRLEPEDFITRMEKAKAHSYYKPSVFLEQISKEDYGYLEEKLYKYTGFYVQSRTLRQYPLSIAAHILGYVGEVNSRNLEADHYYSQGDYIGKSGIEKAYEKQLRGQKGLKIKMVDVFNREKGSFQEGKYDTLAVAGNDLQLTIDAELQIYGEALMNNKRGSVVAIEPSTGEILALVSSPNYDPNLLIGRVRGKNFAVLSNDTLMPLFNRATMAQYPPGSTFKTVNALIGMQEGKLFPETEYPCKGTVTRPIPCSHDHESPLDLTHAIEQSCNPYFYQVYKSILEQPGFTTIQEGYTLWRDYVLQFGVGNRLETDLTDQRPGNLPKDAYFDKYYGKKGWKTITVRSLAVGQGEVEMTPLQLANLSCILGNRGHFYSPHIVKNVENREGNDRWSDERHEIDIDKSHFEDVVQGMQLVYEGEHGSARWYQFADSTAAGKTGTSQNPHGKNHSIFIAFSPVQNPQIAIAVVVENAGYGSTWAAPIASLMMEKYLTGSVVPKWWEDKMLNTNLLKRN